MVVYMGMLSIWGCHLYGDEVEKREYIEVNLVHRLCLLNVIIFESLERLVGSPHKREIRSPAFCTKDFLTHPNPTAQPAHRK